MKDKDIRRHSFDILDYGAVPDGTTLNTTAIQKALDAATVAGGEVVVPPGTFLTGTIIIKSRTTLRLAQGATLLGSPRLEDYAHPIGWGWPHDDQNCDVTPWHLIQSLDSEHVAITGEGTIAGNGPAFWAPDRQTDWHFWKHIENKRPSPMVHIENCRHVRIENVTLRESAGWTLHLHNCESVRVNGITIRNTYFGPNTDGMDISNCRRVIVTGCDVETGDDAIAVMGSGYGGPSEDIVIGDCVLRTSCVGIRVIGFDAKAIHRRIHVSNVSIPRCSRVFDLRSVNGSLIEHVNIAHVVASTNCGWPVNRPIEVVAVAAPNPHGTQACSRGTVRLVSIQDVDVTTDGRCIIAAQKGHTVEDVSLRDLRFRFAMLDAPGSHVIAAGQEHSFFGGRDNSDIRGAMAAILVKNASRVRVGDLSVKWPAYPVPDDWRLLDTTWPGIISPDIYDGKIGAIRSGRVRPTFKVLWARDTRDCRFDVSELTDSEGGKPDDIAKG